METVVLGSRGGDRLSLEVCEEMLRSLGLSDTQIQELGATIDVIGDALLDRYFSQFYE